MRALLLLVLIGLIATGVLYLLFDDEPVRATSSSFSSTLEEWTSLVIRLVEESGLERSGENGDLDLGRWLSKGDPEPARSEKRVYYQYVDGSGTVHFVARLADVPAEWQSKVGRIELERTAPAPGRGATRAAGAPRAAAEGPAERPSGYRSGPEVVVYTTAWCGWCRKTLAFLDERGVRYVNKDIEADDGNREELIEKTGRASIPVVEIDGEIIRGYNAARMEQLLAGSG